MDSLAAKCLVFKQMAVGSMTSAADSLQVHVNMYMFLSENVLRLIRHLC